MKNNTANIWVLIPAGGVGKRMNNDCPKQYLTLGGKPVLHHVLQQFCDNAHIRSVVLGLQDNDRYWHDHKFDHTKLAGVFSAGVERMDTVSNGIDYLRNEWQAQENDWLMVHDAARPLIAQSDINQVIDLAQEKDCGVVVGQRVSDTLKRVAENNRVEQSVNRSMYWRAMTPQIFRLGQLQKALKKSKQEGIIVTDESMAMEQAGYPAMMFEGDAKNIKLTYADDLTYAEFCLSRQLA